MQRAMTGQAGPGGASRHLRHIHCWADHPNAADTRHICRCPAVDGRRMTRILFAGGRVFDGSGAPPAPSDVVVADSLVVDVGSVWTVTRRSTVPA